MKIIRKWKHLVELGIDLTSDYGNWGVGEENFRPKGPEEYSFEAPPGPSAALLCLLTVCAPHSVNNNFKNLFFIVPLSHNHLSPIASSLPGYQRVFWGLKHNPQLLL